MTRITRSTTTGAPSGELLLPTYLAQRSITLVEWIGDFKNYSDNCASVEKPSGYVARLRLAWRSFGFMCAVVVHPTDAPRERDLSAYAITGFAKQHAPFERAYMPQWLAELDECLDRLRDNPTERRYRWSRENGPWTLSAPEHPTDWRIRTYQELPSHATNALVAECVDDVTRRGLFLPRVRLLVDYHR